MPRPGSAEARVDPGFVHSNGEIGLSAANNITFWIGSGAPAWNRPMPIEVNIESYAFYLAQIRNKSVTTASGRILYRPLRVGGCAGTPERRRLPPTRSSDSFCQPVTYRGGRVPFDRILSGIAQDEPVDRILSGTDYVQCRHTILTDSGQQQYRRTRRLPCSRAALMKREALDPLKIEASPGSGTRDYGAMPASSSRKNAE